MRFKALLAVGIVVSLAFAGTAAAENLTGHQELLGKDSGKGSGCFLNLVSLTRVDRQDTRNRWVRAESNIACDADWNKAHLSMRVNGATDTKHWGTRDYKIQNLHDGVTAGRTTVVQKMTCNIKQGGKWVYPEGRVGLYSWAEVHNSAEWFVQDIEDRDTKVRC
jgi:hypothetical protein